jgi:5'-nucleotidase
MATLLEPLLIVGMGLVVMLIVLACCCDHPAEPVGTIGPMAAPSLENKLVVAISSRALFDFEEENRVFESGDAAGYMRTATGTAGAAGQAGHRLLADPQAARLQRRRRRSGWKWSCSPRNDPSRACACSARPTTPASHLQRGVFTQGRSPSATCGR